MKLNEIAKGYMLGASVVIISDAIIYQNYHKLIMIPLIYCAVKTGMYIGKITNTKHLSK